MAQAQATQAFKVTYTNKENRQQARYRKTRQAADQIANGLKAKGYTNILISHQTNPATKDGKSGWEPEDGESAPSNTTENPKPAKRKPVIEPKAKPEPAVKKSSKETQTQLQDWKEKRAQKATLKEQGDPEIQKLKDQIMQVETEVEDIKASVDHLDEQESIVNN